MQFRRNRFGVLGGAGAALACAALLAAGALAAAPPTDLPTYVAQVEPICKTNTKANERILTNVRREIKQGKLKLAAGQFKQASVAFGKGVKQISAVPQPVAYQAKLTKWLGLLGKEQKILGEIGNALKANKKGLAQSLSLKLTRNGNAANNAVLGFEFDDCLIDSSRFS